MFKTVLAKVGSAPAENKFRNGKVKR